MINARGRDGKNTTLNEKNTNVLDGIPDRKSRKSTDNSADELILSLSNAYENQRARQVFEWESVRRQNVQRAA